MNQIDGNAIEYHHLDWKAERSRKLRLETCRKRAERARRVVAVQQLFSRSTCRARAVSSPYPKLALRTRQDPNTHLQRELQKPPAGPAIALGGVAIELVGVAIEAAALPHMYDAINAYNDGLVDRSMCSMQEPR